MNRAAARRKLSRLRHVLGLLAVACIGCESGPPPPILDLPPRAPNAPGGAQLAEEIAPLDRAAREERIVRELIGGNVPEWLRELHPVRFTRDAGDRSHDVLFWVTADYLAVGSDEDYLLVPLSPRTAQQIADSLDASLPTPAMVDDVWLAADSRLAPQRLPPRDSVQSVRTVAYFLRHTNVIGGQRQVRGVPPGSLVAGHKKDVVVTNELAANPGKVAIYGMHRTDGVPTQELSTVPRSDWVYYNHGIRLVHERVRIDGAEMDLRAILRDPELAPLLSDEGPLLSPRYPTDDDR